MTTLFRPWAEVVVIDKRESLTRLPTEPFLQQDSTVSTTTAVDQTPKQEDVASREVKYKSVKEHMRRRSEKYWQKKLSKKELPQEQIGSACHYGPACPIQTPDLVDANPILLPGFCCPADSIATHYDKLYPVKNSVCGEFGFTNSPELLETALSQGLPPSLVEEYARLLTEQQRQISERNRKQRPKKFRCPHCQVGFSNNGQLKGHIRIHTGERPFKCDAESCGKSFTRNEELTRHRRIHSGLRPFPCPECGKRFGRKDHLKKHVKTHFQQRFQLVPILPSHYPYIYGF